MKAQPRKSSKPRKRPTLPYIKAEKPSRRPIPLTLEQRVARIEKILLANGLEIMRGQKSSIYPMD